MMKYSLRGIYYRERPWVWLFLIHSLKHHTRNVKFPQSRTRGKFCTALYFIANELNELSLHRRGSQSSRKLIITYEPEWMGLHFSNKWRHIISDRQRNIETPILPYTFRNKRTAFQYSLIYLNSIQHSIMLILLYYLFYNYIYLK